MGKATLVFDASARKDFITGFHKRKVERRQQARQRIAGEVRQEKLDARREKREQLKTLRGIGLGEAAVGAAGGSLGGDRSHKPGARVEGPAPKPGSASAAAEEDNAERATYEFDGMVATTFVSSLEPEPEPEAPRRPRPAGQRGSSTPRPKDKKFNLDMPLATAIPGYKNPKKMPKRKKEKKRRGPIGKKEKAKNRASARRSDTTR
jgi:ribosomal RNA-processing protein 17